MKLKACELARESIVLEYRDCNTLSVYFKILRYLTI